MALLKFQKGRARATGRRRKLAVLLSGLHTSSKVFGGWRLCCSDERGEMGEELVTGKRVSLEGAQTEPPVGTQLQFGHVGRSRRMEAPSWGIILGSDRFACQVRFSCGYLNLTMADKRW